MKWVSTIAVRRAFADAIDEALGDLSDQLGETVPDVVLAFVSSEYAAHAPDLAGPVRERFPQTLIMGCTAGGVAGGGREIEGEPALALCAAALPGVNLTPFHLELGELPRAGVPDETWFTNVPPEREPVAAFILLPDPFSMDVERLVDGLDVAYPGVPKIGGLASGAANPGENLLYLQDEIHRSGVVGVALSGNLVVDTVLAQGCRPIGEPMFVTRCQNNVLYALDGRPATEVVEGMFESLNEEDRTLFRQSVFLGVGINESQQIYSQGDFLVRSVMGFDPEASALGVGTMLRENQVVQFHVRDARTSAADLRDMLKNQHQRGTSAEGALLFSCMGRGRTLYGHGDHDTKEFHAQLGPVPLTGFFCAGEIGPVRGQTFIHGYTSVFSLFRAQEPD